MRNLMNGNNELIFNDNIRNDILDYLAKTRKLSK